MSRLGRVHGGALWDLYVHGGALWDLCVRGGALRDSYVRGGALWDLCDRGGALWDLYVREAGDEDKRGKNGRKAAHFIPLFPKFITSHLLYYTITKIK